ncbi:hypothetical protein D3C78_1874110 [compost metagenome]
MPHSGFSAASTAGLPTMPCTPSAASAANHSIITGPNSLPTLAVPCFWIRNRPVSTASASGST